jgi:glutaminyl-tRNA synthetase
VDLDSKSGSGTEASLRKVKGTLHWVSIAHAITAEVREYDRLFLDEAPDAHEDKNFMEFINPNSLNIIKKAYLEPYLAQATLDDKYQFQRLGYFTLDTDSKEGQLIFNKTVGLKDSWAKQNTAAQQPKQPAVQQNQGKRSPLNEIQQLSKKLTNLPEEKLANAKASILKLAEEVSYEEIEPLFNTAAKKVGTRIGVMLVLGVLLKNGQEKTEAAQEFINAGLNDDHEMLKAEAAAIQ